MAKKIFPGNYVNRPDSYVGQPVVVRPGLLCYNIVGYFPASSTSGVVFDPIIAAPKESASDVTSLVIPAGAIMTRRAIRLTEAIAGTNTDILKLGTGVDDATGADVTAGSGVYAAGAVKVDVISPDLGAALGSAATLKLYVSNADEDDAGTAITLTSDVYFEVCYLVPDDVVFADEVYRAISN